MNEILAEIDTEIFPARFERKAAPRTVSAVETILRQAFN